MKRNTFVSYLTSIIISFFFSFFFEIIVAFFSFYFEYINACKILAKKNKLIGLKNIQSTQFMHLKEQKSTKQNKDIRMVSIKINPFI
jgi:hypothetical protein